MPTEIPGYYYDQEKGKYFKIQPNHIAPKDSPYSRQAVTASKRTETVVRRQERADQAKRVAHVQRDRVWENYVSSDPIFQRRLGHVRGSTTDILGSYYARSLHSQITLPARRTDEVFGSEIEWPVDKDSSFTIDPQSGDLYTSCQVGRITTSSGFFNSYMFMRFPFEDDMCDDEQENNDNDDDDDDDDDMDQQNTLKHNGYAIRRKKPEEIRQSRKVTEILTLPGGLVMYLHNDWNLAGNCPSLAMYMPYLDDGFGTITEMFMPHKILEMAARPTDHSAWSYDLSIPSAPTKIVMSTVKGIEFCDVTDFHRVSFSKPDKPIFEEDSYMTASFKDQNTFMTGTQSGRIIFGDVRGGATMRLRHACAVSAVEPLRDGNQVVVCGLTKVSVYDLRFTSSTPTSSTPARSNGIDLSLDADPSSRVDGIPTENNSSMMSRDQPSDTNILRRYERPGRRQRRQQNRERYQTHTNRPYQYLNSTLPPDPQSESPSPLPSSSSTTPTTILPLPRRRKRTPPPKPVISYSQPLFDLPLPMNRLPSRYGMGFHFSLATNLLYISSTDLNKLNHVTVYSAKDGRVIPCALNERKFDDVVRTLKSGPGTRGGGWTPKGVRIGEDGDRNQDRTDMDMVGESLYLQYADAIEEWSPV